MNTFSLLLFVYFYLTSSGWIILRLEYLIGSLLSFGFDYKIIYKYSVYIILFISSYVYLTISTPN